MDATNKSAAEELLTHLDELGVNSKVLVEQGLLDGWKQPQRTWLLSYALEERSLPAVQLAVAQGSAIGLDNATLQSMLTDITRWCASRSLRFRLQDALIGRGSDKVHVLRYGEDGAAQEEVIEDLLKRIPTLKRRGAERLHGLLRRYMQRAPYVEDVGEEVAEEEADQRVAAVAYEEDGNDAASLLREQVTVDMLDSLAVSLCSPFLTTLVGRWALSRCPRAGCKLCCDATGNPAPLDIRLSRLQPGPTGGTR